MDEDSDLKDYLCHWRARSGEPGLSFFLVKRIKTAPEYVCKPRCQSLWGHYKKDHGRWWLHLAWCGKRGNGIL